MRVGLHLTALIYIQHDRKVAPDHKILSFNLCQNMQLTASNTPHSHFPPVPPQEGETNPELKYKAAKLYTRVVEAEEICVSLFPFPSLQCAKTPNLHVNYLCVSLMLTDGNANTEKGQICCPGSGNVSSNPLTQRLNEPRASTSNFILRFHIKK